MLECYGILDERKKIKYRRVTAGDDGERGDDNTRDP